MWFPRLAYYSIEELAELWGISAELIQKYTERGQLSYETLYHDEYYDDVWVPRDAPPGEPYQYHQFRTWFLRGQFYKLEEVERFEREHSEEVAGDHNERQPENQLPEKVATQKRVKTPIRKPGVKNRLTLSLENARALLIGKNKKEPTCRQVKDYLKLDDPLGCVMDFGKDDTGSFLGWEDNSGKYHKARDKSIANKLTKIKKENNWL